MKCFSQYERITAILKKVFIGFMLIGYARVSTNDQNLDLQKNILEDHGCKKIFEDVMSGIKNERPGLLKLMEHLREGDTLVVLKLDRLGRSVKNLIDFVNELENKKVNLKSISDKIDTSTPMGKFFFHMMASLAEMEREILVERTKLGLNAAKIRGSILGRKRKMTDSKIESAKKLMLSGISAKEVAKNLNISVPTLYRWVPAGNMEMVG